MKDVWFKFRILFALIQSDIETWKKEVWPRELDSPYCCSGTAYDECGCGGSTVRDMWTFNARLK